MRTRDNVKRFQKNPPGASLSEKELTDAVDVLEAQIAENGRLMALAGGRGITRLPGVEKLLNALREGGARWGIVTSGTPGTFPSLPSVYSSAELFPCSDEGLRHLRSVHSRHCASDPPVPADG